MTPDWSQYVYLDAGKGCRCFCFPKTEKKEKNSKNIHLNLVPVAQHCWPQGSLLLQKVWMALCPHFSYVGGYFPKKFLCCCCCFRPSDIGSFDPFKLRCVIWISRKKECFRQNWLRLQKVAEWCWKLRVVPCGSSHSCVWILVSDSREVSVKTVLASDSCEDQMKSSVQCCCSGYTSHEDQKHCAGDSVEITRSFCPER